GAIPAVESGYMKERLVESNARRIAAIEAGEQVVVGVNKHRESAPSPLTTGAADFLTVDEQAEAAQIANLHAWREQRDGPLVWEMLKDLEAAARAGDNIMPVSIQCAHAGVTTGEWAAVLRSVYGEYRAPTGVARAGSTPGGSNSLAELRERVDDLSARLGRRLTMLVGKPGLDGHSNGAEQVAVRARACGLRVIRDGSRLTPQQIAEAAAKEGAHVVGLSVLSGSHVTLVEEVIARLKQAGLGHVPVVVGGIIPAEDEAQLKAAGVARVYT